MKELALLVVKFFQYHRVYDNKPNQAQCVDLCDIFETGLRHIVITFPPLHFDQTRLPKKKCYIKIDDFKN